ncbi:MAG TPA: TlpA disulfide reductase family protein [Pirellulaceae bacterium]|nr:TlpA disulfide reductase family protein [Pirellulaceae bacterium]
MNEQLPPLNENLPDQPRRRPIGIWLLLAVGLVVVLAVRWFRPPEAGRDGAAHPAVGRQVTFVSLKPLTGKADDVSLEDLQGKVTLINYWGPWCGPCRIEFPHLYELRQSFRQQAAAQVISVSCSRNEGAEDNSPEDVRATQEFLREQNADMPTYYDPFYKSRRQLVETAGLEAFSYPTTVILDGSGTIRGLWQGYVPGDELAMHRLVKELVEE